MKNEARTHVAESKSTTSGTAVATGDEAPRDGAREPEPRPLRSRLPTGSKTRTPHPESSRAMARIVALLQARGSLSAQEIAREAHVAEKTLTCGSYLKRLRQARLIHIAGWRKNCSGFSTALYSAGNRTDCPRPAKFREVDRDSPGMARIVGALKRLGNLTGREAAEAAGLSANTVSSARYMDILVEQGRIHILGWRRNKHGAMTPVYRAGAGTNAARPAPYSPAAKTRRWRARQEPAGTNDRPQPLRPKRSGHPTP